MSVLISISINNLKDSSRPRQRRKVRLSKETVTTVAVAIENDTREIQIIDHTCRIASNPSLNSVVKCINIKLYNLLLASVVAEHWVTDQEVAHKSNGHGNKFVPKKLGK